MCQFQCKDSIIIVSCVWLWTSSISTHWVVFELCGILIISMFHICEKIYKKKFQTCIEEWKCCAIEEPHQLRFCWLLFQNKTKSWSCSWIRKMFFTIWKENNYHSKMTDHLIIILQNPTTTWVARMPLVKKKKQEFCYDNILIAMMHGYWDGIWY